MSGNGDFISREAAKKKHCEICLEEFICYRSKTTCDKLKAFDLIPAADVREVVRGDWGQIEEVDDGGPLSAWLLSRYHAYACSICGFKFLNLHEDDRMYNFCPNCGADMRPEPPKEET